MSVLQRTARGAATRSAIAQAGGPGTGRDQLRQPRDTTRFRGAEKDHLPPAFGSRVGRHSRGFDVADRRYRKGAQLDVDSSGSRSTVSPDPSVFVISRDGIVIWRFVSEHEELRLTAGSILERSIHEAVNQTRTAVAAGKTRLNLTASDTSANLGSRVTIGIELEIQDGWHVYSPQAGGEYHALAWRIEESECSFVGEASYPEPQWDEPVFADRKLPTYQGTVRLTRKVAATVADD